MLRSKLESKKFKTEKECEIFEEFISNLEQYMGKPSHVHNVGNVSLETKWNNNQCYIRIQGDETAVEIAQDLIRDY